MKSIFSPLLFRIFIFFVLAFFSCKNYTSLPSLEVIPFDTNECYQVVVDGRYVLSDETEYQSVIQTFKVDSLQFPNCHDILPPIVSFNDYTLLGIRKCGSGCETIFEQNVWLDEPNEKYIFEVKVEEIGSCEPWRCQMNWVLVPRLPDGYMVEFL